MPFTIVLSQTAKRHLGFFKRPRDRNLIIDAIQLQLAHEPESESRARKKLRDNPLASWELREGDFQIFYEVATEQSHVEVVAIGIKMHNKLYIEGKEFQL